MTSSKKTYVWGTPEVDSYFNWALISWRFAGVFLFGILFLPFILAFIIAPEFIFLSFIGVWILWSGIMAGIMDIFEYGRAAEEKRLHKEKPWVMQHPRLTGFENALPEHIREERKERTKKTIAAYREKRKTWRKERRRRWISGNFRQFPMGDWQRLEIEEPKEVTFEDRLEIRAAIARSRIRNQ